MTGATIMSINRSPPVPTPSQPKLDHPDLPRVKAAFTDIRFQANAVVALQEATEADCAAIATALGGGARVHGDGDCRGAA